MPQIASGPLISYVLVGLGSAAGGMLRYACSVLFGGRFAFPWGTLFVNVSGSFLIGVISALTLADGRWSASPLLRDLLMVGVLGGYTTFSAFSLQTLTLLREDRWGLAAANILASVLLSVLAVGLGYLVAGGLRISPVAGAD